MSEKTKKHRPTEALALGPIITDVKLALDRFQFTYERGGDVSAAMVDLLLNVEDLDDAVDKNEAARSTDVR